VTEESPSPEKAAEALIYLVSLNRGSAVIHVTTESLVVRMVTPSTAGTPGSNPKYDREGRLISLGKIPGPASRGERTLGMKYKCRGTVVRCRDGG